MVIEIQQNCSQPEWVKHFSHFTVCAPEPASSNLAIQTEGFVVSYSRKIKKKKKRLVHVVLLSEKTLHPEKVK